MNRNTKRYVAECAGTAVLVLVGCGSIALGGLSGSPVVNVAVIGLAFGIAVAAMAYALGPISGAHINPAVTVGMWAAGKMKPMDAFGYVVAQLIGAVIGAAILWLILSGRTGGFNVVGANLGQNGFGTAYSVQSAAIVEFLATLIFVVVILNVTMNRAAAPVAGLVIGLTLFALHLPFFSVTGLSVNPARSLGPAIFAGGAAQQQLWLFLIVPTVAGAAAGWLVRNKFVSA